MRSPPGRTGKPAWVPSIWQIVLQHATTMLEIFEKNSEKESENGVALAKRLHLNYSDETCRKTKQNTAHPLGNSKVKLLSSAVSGTADMADVSTAPRFQG